MSPKVRRYTLATILVLLAICAAISISYGYYVFSSNKSYELSSMTSLPSCVGLNIADTKLIKLEGDYAVPFREAQVLNSSSTVLANFKYSFTVTNDCSSSATMSIGIAPLSDSTIPIGTLKYVLVPSGQAMPSSASQFSESNAKTIPADVKELLNRDVGLTANKVYNFSSVTLGSKASKSYDFYLWIDYNEGSQNNSTMNKKFNATLIVNSFS